MSTGCDTSVRDHEVGPVRWTVEEGAYSVFVAHRNDRYWWGNEPPMVWVPDIEQPADALVVHADIDRIGNREGLMRLGLARLDPDAVADRMQCRVMPPKDIDACCLGPGVVITGGTAEHRQVARVHSPGRRLRVKLPALRPAYSGRSSTAGNPVVLDGEPCLDRLSAAGALVAPDGLYVLWKDADGEERGWEKVPSLRFAREAPRFAVREHTLLVIGGPSVSIVGFSEPAAARTFDQMVSERRYEDREI